MTKPSNLEIALKSQLNSSQSACDEFAEALAKDPAHAFAWAADPMMHAARVKVYTELLAQLATGLGIDVPGLREQILNRAKYPKSSSSATANLMWSNETAARVEALELVCKVSNIKL